MPVPADLIGSNAQSLLGDETCEAMVIDVGVEAGENLRRAAGEGDIMACSDLLSAAGGSSEDTKKGEMPDSRPLARTNSNRQQHADVNSCDEDGRTALHCAVKSKHVDGEAINTPFWPLQENFHTFVLRGLIRNISEAPYEFSPANLYLANFSPPHTWRW